MKTTSILNRSVLTLVFLALAFVAIAVPFRGHQALSTLHWFLSACLIIFLFVDFYRLWFPARWTTASAILLRTIDSASFCFFMMCLYV